jgi:hypothetical protein
VGAVFNRDLAGLSLTDNRSNNLSRANGVCPRPELAEPIYKPKANKAGYQLNVSFGSNLLRQGFSNKFNLDFSIFDDIQETA